MSDHATHAVNEHHGFAHPAPVWQLLAVFFALIVLTFLTVLQSTFELGNLELGLSLFIATIKAALVIMFFMHMLHDKPLNAIVFLSSFIFVALFLGFTLMDAGAYRDSIELKEVDSPRAVRATETEHSAEAEATAGDAAAEEVH
ncbi:MAG: cytochrome C oxidase subunit IV family protein [Planctomycetales bacterium]|nr:cytochrome C oxidase subunit IV family protein [Planctomycetales bacterium]